MPTQNVLHGLRGEHISSFGHTDLILGDELFIF